MKALYVYIHLLVIALIAYIYHFIIYRCILCTQASMSLQEARYYEHRTRSLPNETLNEPWSYVLVHYIEPDKGPDVSVKKE